MDKLNYGNDLAYVDDMLIQMMLVLVQEASDDFWKILKYGATDATVNPSYTITLQEKQDMIKQNLATTKVLLKRYNNDISTDAHSEIRLFNSTWDYVTVGSAVLRVGFEIISHNKLIVLDDGRTTINFLRHEIYRIFNNRSILKGIGRISSLGSRGVTTTFNDLYQGYSFELEVGAT